MPYLATIKSSIEGAVGPALENSIVSALQSADGAA